MPRSCWCPEYCTRYLGTRRLCGGAGLDSGTDNVTVLDVLIGRRGAIGATIEKMHRRRASTESNPTREQPKWLNIP